MNWVLRRMPAFSPPGWYPPSPACPSERSLPMRTATTSVTTRSTKLGTPFPATARFSLIGLINTSVRRRISASTGAVLEPRREFMPDAPYSPQEIMTIAAARRLKNGAVCFVGIGLPSAAANLARITHAPGVVLIYESGTIGAKPNVLPLSIGDGELAETADTVVSVPEIFRYWLQGGRVDVGFLGAAQIDKFGNINTTVIGGTYESPQVRLPGAGGAPEIATSCKEVTIILRQSRRAFVERLDFVTSSGYVSTPESGGRQSAGARPDHGDYGFGSARQFATRPRTDAGGAAPRSNSGASAAGNRMGSKSGGQSRVDSSSHGRRAGSLARPSRADSSSARNVSRR